MTPMTIARRIRKKDEGFTLVELMVVVMIIAILMAIAIPTFLNSRKRAQDSGAKSNARNALAAAQSVFSENQTYPVTATMVTSLADEEPSLNFSAGASTDPKTISVITIPATSSAPAAVVVSSQSKSGKCFSFKNVVAAGGGTTEYEAASGTSCQAAASPPSSTVTTTTATTI